MDEHTTSRRRFLGTAAGATGVALGAAVWGANQAAAAAVSGAPAQRLMADKRGFVAGKFSLEIDEQSAGWVQDADGGQAFSDVVTEKMGADHIAHKHIGNPKYEDITVTAGFGLEKTFFDWMSAAWKWQLPAVRKSGAIVVADFNLVERTRRSFYNALITETTIPACDASLKQAGFLTVKFSPEFTRTQKGGGGKVSAPIAVQQKMWSPSNFRLEIDGLDCTKVNKIDSFTVKQSFIDSPVGENRIPGNEPGAIEFPNLAITLAATSSATWEQWFDDFVIKGNDGQEAEKNGTLTFLSPQQAELGTVKFFNMGIFKLDDDASEDASGNPVQRFKAEMYVERMEISIIGGAGKPGPSPTPPPPPTG